MKVEFVNTTNQNFLHFVGRVGELTTREGFSATFDYGSATKVFMTSVVMKVTISGTDGNDITLETLNSVYEFKRVL